MTRIDPLLGIAPVAKVAGPHQSTVATILRAVELGLFTAADADLMIDRVRAHLIALPITSPITAPVASLSSASPPPQTRPGTPMPIARR
jgi:hypothetical protein